MKSFRYTPNEIKFLIFESPDISSFPLISLPTYSVAYFNDVVVGGVCCRVDVVQIPEGSSGPPRKTLYIMTLGTLAPYRGYGVGTMLLNHVFSLCERDPSIRSVSLHVQVLINY